MEHDHQKLRAFYGDMVLSRSESGNSAGGVRFSGFLSFYSVEFCHLYTPLKREFRDKIWKLQ